MLPTESAPSALPHEARSFAERLIPRHGSLRVAQEASGLHFYLPCPQCLQEEGESEIFKKHLAVNVDKVLANVQQSVLCMKCGYKCEAIDLEFLPPLEERGIEYKPEVLKIEEPNLDYLELDSFGRMVPKPPGEIVPVHQLPEDHPACFYLRSRQFDLEALWRQFECSWCEAENPNLYYRRQPGGFRVTPQGRLIFFCLQEGSKVGWQARILECEENDIRYFWHPYKKDWVEVMRRASEGQWVLRAGFEEWDPAKYWTAPGTRRIKIVMGLDAALAWNESQGRRTHDRRLGLLVEGPLDAARLGAPAMAVLGKSLTAYQAELLSSNFGRVLVVADNDVPGKKLRESASRHMLHKKIKLEFLNLPERFKDAGSMSPIDGRMFFHMALKTAAQL